MLPDLVKALPGFLLELSLDGIILDANALFDHAVETSAYGRPVATFVDASSKAKVARILANPKLASESTWELILIRADVGLESHNFSVLPGDGRVWLVELPRGRRVEQLNQELSALTTNLVTTQRELARDRARLASAYKKLEEQNTELERANRQLDDFAHVVSHDLRAPLRAIRTFAQWIEQDLGEQLSGESREHFSLLQNRVGLLDTMISNILMLARAGHTAGRSEPVDVGELLEEVVLLLQPPPTVTISGCDTLPVLTTRRAELQQVLMNLVGNALRHGGPDLARITVSAVPTDKGHTFRVSDDGRGIPAAAQERIWLPFQTASPREDIDGSGIGLAVVRKIVESRGGTMHVISEPGNGATFVFDWPNDPEEE